MIKHIYSCRLLSDVVISQSSATEEKHETLDYIPGSYFLGVAAKTLYSSSSPENFDLFHSGKVHFGDAQLSDKSNVKALKTPLNLFNLKDNEEVFFFYPDGKNDDDKQDKQVRNGYILNGALTEVQKDFTLRTATENRTAKEGSLYGYQSLKAGQKFVFEVIGEDEILLKKIKPTLTGNQHIGRSKSAEYGLVEICFEREENLQNLEVDKGQEVVIYAEGNLSFFDENGHPTYQPTADDLGITKGEILWDKCQIRTRNFALFNNHRMTRDSHIHAIEKGSVFVVRAPERLIISENCIGEYKAIGFGKVRYQPNWGVIKKLSLDKKKDYAGEQQVRFLETDSNPFDIERIKGYLAYQNRLKDLDKVKDGLSKYAKASEFKKLGSGSQWSYIIGLLDRVNEDYLKDNGTKPFDSIKNKVKNFVENGSRSKIWNKAKADKKLIEVIKDAESQYKDWEFFYVAMRSLLIKLR